MDELLRNAAGDIQLNLPQNPDGPPTVTVTDGNGATVASGTSSQVGTDTTLFKYTLTPANLANLDIYTATWLATIGGVTDTYLTYFEVVGGFLFTIEELRAFDTQITATNYPDAKVRDARAQASQRIEDLCGVSFRLRGNRFTLDGSGDEVLYLENFEPRTLVSGTIDGTALAGADITDIALYPEGRAVRKTRGSWTQGDRNVVVYYTHGYTQAPLAIRRAAMLLARAILVPFNVPDRATSLSTDEGTFTLSTPGQNGSQTGIPEVDQIVKEHALIVPGVA